MKLKDLGEFGFIHLINQTFKQTLPPNITGIGDDCAIISLNEETSFLVTTDMLIEQVHFIAHKIKPEDLGYKSLAVNLSDIAAMGGQPLYAFLSIGLPEQTLKSWILSFFDGFHQLAAQHHVYLLGGDTTRSSQICINISVIGSSKPHQIKERHQAKPGDIICCTGYLGDSGAGLKIILEHPYLIQEWPSLTQAHIRPRPHLEEGKWLATHSCVHAMMDISDGLASDIQHIMESSACGAHIEVDRLPLSKELNQLAQQEGWIATDLALTAGEDYCLLVTIDPQHYSSLNQAYLQHFKRPLFAVGTIQSFPHGLTYSLDGHPYSLNKTGFDHFKD